MPNKNRIFKSLPIILVIVIYPSFYFIKNAINYYTPDEIFYTTSKIPPFQSIDLKFLITKFVISYFYYINRYLYPLINTLVVLITLSYIKSVFVDKSRRLKTINILFIFLLPSVVYLTNAYLRDIYVYIFTLLFVFPPVTKINQYWIKLISFIIFTILRPELGFIVLLAYLSAKYVKFKVSFKIMPIIYAIFIWIIIISLLQIDFLRNNFFDLVWNYEKSTYGFSVFQLPLKVSNVILYSPINWFAFFCPYFFVNLDSPFNYLMLIDSIMIGFLVIKAIKNFRKNKFVNDEFYRLCFFVFLGTFFISLPETLPATIFRHRMGYLPFIFYLNFMGYRKSLKNNSTQPITYYENSNQHIKP